MTMIERVAHQLEPQAWAALGTVDTLAYKNRRVSSIRKARNVIEAMRWPTYEMRDAGARRGNWNENELGNELDCADNVWFAMIDQALKDEA